VSGRTYQGNTPYFKRSTSRGISLSKKHNNQLGERKRNKMSSLFEIVARFGGDTMLSSEEILSLTSLQFSNGSTNDLSDGQDRQRDVKIFLKNVKDSLGAHEYQIFLDLMVQIRQGYRTDQPALVVEVSGIIFRIDSV
jgi:hypothetical protein